MRTEKDIEDMCRKLKPVIGFTKATKLWYAYLAEDEKGRRDLALDIEIIAEKLLKKGMLQGQEILLEPPSVFDSRGEFLLGDIVYNGRKLHRLFLDSSNFIKQCGIFGITGEGKSNLGYLLALQLLKAGIPFTVIDWKRGWRNLLSLQDRIPELKQVQIYTVGRNVAPFLWNPFRAPPDADRELWISTIAEVLEKSHISGPGVAYYLNMIYSGLFKKIEDKNFYPNFHDGLRELEKIRAYEREFRWKQTALRIFKSFLIGPVSKVFNKRDPARLENLLDKFVILELDLEMPKPHRIFFTELILRWIHLFRMSQGETDELRHVLFLEEVHNLFPRTRIEREASNSLENVYREIRGFGQGLVSITQHPSLLPIYILGNTHSQCYLGLQHADDIRTARNSLFLRQNEEAYPNMLKVGECIAKVKNRIEPCLVKIPFVPVKKGIITDEWLKIHMRGYSMPASDDKNDENRGYSGRDNNRDVNTPEYANTPLGALLIDILNNPLSSLTQRYRKLNISTGSCDKYKRRLIEDGFIKQVKIVMKTGWITLFELTQKGKATLRDLGYEVSDERESITHKFWKQKIFEHYRNRNYKVLVEEHVNGRPDIIVIGHGARMAIEIETGNSDFVQNIEKDLRAGFDGIVCVATSRQVEEKIRQQLQERNLADRVKITSVLGFDM